MKHFITCGKSGREDRFDDGGDVLLLSFGLDCEILQQQTSVAPLIEKIERYLVGTKSHFDKKYALHIVAHGSSGMLRFGTPRLVSYFTKALRKLSRLPTLIFVYACYADRIAKLFHSQLRNRCVKLDQNVAVVGVGRNCVVSLVRDDCASHMGSTLAFLRALFECFDRDDHMCRLSVLFDCISVASLEQGSNVPKYEPVTVFGADEHDISKLLIHEVFDNECRYEFIRVRVDKFNRRLASALEKQK